jgi:hypothetical protein
LQPDIAPMNATVFDTHRIVKRLKEAGFSDIQAETRYGCAQREPDH